MSLEGYTSMYRIDDDFSELRYAGTTTGPLENRQRQDGKWSAGGWSLASRYGQPKAFPQVSVEYEIRNLS